MPSLAEQKSSYNFAVDVLRIVAITAVVGIHTTTKVLEATHYNIAAEFITLFFNQSLRFAVPLFFLISGFVLELNYRELFHYSTYFKRRAARLIIPYLFWSLFYWVGIFHYPLFSINFLFALLVGSASYQLYFIPTLIIFYALFPLFHRYYSFIKNKLFLVVIIISEIFLLGYDYYIHRFSLADPLRVSLLNLGIFILGMIASHHETSILSFFKKYSLALKWSLLLLPLFLTIQSGYLYLTTHRLDAIYSQYHPFVYCYTLLLSVVLFSIFTRWEPLRKKVLLLSKLSFFVFFVHIAFLYLFWNTLGRNLLQSLPENILFDILYNLFFFVTVAILSFLAAWIIHTLPWVKRITG